MNTHLKGRINMDVVTWKEVYEYWRLYSMYGSSILNSPIEPIEIFVDYPNRESVFYGYDWLTRDRYYARKSTIENNVNQFLYFTEPTNKGTIHTLNMLVNSISDEERAAIWIYTFAKEISEKHGAGNSHKYCIMHLQCYTRFSFTTLLFLASRNEKIDT